MRMLNKAKKARKAKPTVTKTDTKKEQVQTKKTEIRVKQEKGAETKKTESDKDMVDFYIIGVKKGEVVDLTQE